MGIITLDNLSARLANWQCQLRILRLALKVAAHERGKRNQKPIVFFNASTRLTGLSQNAAFSLLASWGLRLAGMPVEHFVCHKGMKTCILGTNRENFYNPPPCKSCIAQSRYMYLGARVHWFDFQSDSNLEASLQGLNVDQLSQFEYSFTLLVNHQSSTDISQPLGRNPSQINIPLGRLVLPSVRWALRRYTLPDEDETQYLLKSYILSAFNIAQKFTLYLCEVQPLLAVIFNGALYPEATARWVALQLGVRVVTHEVGFQRFSAFFTDGEATAYPIHIPEHFELTPTQDALLDAYLEQRFQGKFSMAGIRFWPTMRGLDEKFLQKANQFRQIVPVFTNVVYDTSQVHANRIFPHMFAWLELILELARVHPDTLFVIRAHPDEMRIGTKKLSRESVQNWMSSRGVDRLPNVEFISPQEYISSYDLIQRSKFVMVYNSSIGMEAALMGKAVLCGGKARYTQYPIVFLPDTVEGYQRLAEQFLAAEEIEVPRHFQRNARRFLYYQLYRVSLSFEDFLEEGHRMGFVRLRSFSWRKLLPENCPAIRVLVKGMADIPTDGSEMRQSFLLEEPS